LFFGIAFSRAFPGIVTFEDQKIMLSNFLLSLLTSGAFVSAPGPVVPPTTTLDCTGSSESIAMTADPVQNCNGLAPLATVLTALNVPSGRTFTGNCVNGKCESVRSGLHTVTVNSAIPAGKMFVTAVWRVTYTGSIYPDCVEGGSCNEVSLPVCNEELIGPFYSNCTE
jgi:hypothetical protein